MTDEGEHRFVLQITPEMCGKLEIPYPHLPVARAAHPSVRDGDDAMAVVCKPSRMRSRSRAGARPMTLFRSPRHALSPRSCARSGTRASCARPASGRDQGIACSPTCAAITSRGSSRPAPHPLSAAASSGSRRCAWRSTASCSSASSTSNATSRCIRPVRSIAATSTVSRPTIAARCPARCT